MPNSNYWKHIVLRFGKALTQQPGLLDKPDAFGPQYIPLGYFDSLQLYSLAEEDGSSWLSGLHTHDVNLSNELNDKFFFHPIHCSAFDSETDRLAEFMNIETPYLFITFLQGKCLNDHSGAVNLGVSIQDYLEKNINKENTGREDPVYWALYRSIALSDLIIIWKSTSILAILSAIQKVYYFSMTGDLHSIPTILKASILGDDNAPPIMSEELPQVTIRYLVKNSYAAYDFFMFAGIDEDFPKFTVGIEDLTYVKTNWTTLDLCNIIAKRLTDEEYIGRFRDAFAECDTHIGCTLSLEGEKSFYQSALYQHCNILQTAFHDTRKKLKDAALTDDLDGPWLKASSELYNAQANLCRNMLADGFCFLTLGASSMFQKKMSGIKTHITSNQLYQIQQFIRGWSGLMEQVLRTDGKFSQQPYFTPPPLCEVPSNLLEFYQAFTIQASNIMQSIAGEKEQFALLLVPKLCRRIKVESVFLDAPPCDRLLLVSIPISILYDPFLVLSHLCHEISHFAGNGWRQRDTRANAYFSICAQELAGAFLFSKPETVSAIRQKLPSNSFDFPVYLDMLQIKLYEKLNEILNDTKIVSEWFDIEYSSRDVNMRVGLLESNNRIQNLKCELKIHPNNPSGDFFNIMDEFNDLLRECYADTVAIYTLDLSPREYLRLAAQELKLYERTYTSKGPSYYHAVERWAIALNVSFSPDDLQNLGKDEFAEHIKQCSSFIFQRQSFDSEDLYDLQLRYHKPESVRMLRDYLCDCRRLMEKTTEFNNPELGELRKAFRSVVQKNDVFSEFCQSVVSKYRLNLLN